MSLIKQNDSLRKAKQHVDTMWKEPQVKWIKGKPYPVYLADTSMSKDSLIAMLMTEHMLNDSVEDDSMRIYYDIGFIGQPTYLDFGYMAKKPFYIVKENLVIKDSIVEVKEKPIFHYDAEILLSKDLYYLGLNIKDKKGFSYKVGWNFVTRLPVGGGGIRLR